MAEQTSPQTPPSKLRRVASNVLQAAGESMMMRSPILGQAFEMTQLFKRPEAAEGETPRTRLQNLVDIVKQSAVQNSTILRKMTMFTDSFDTFREKQSQQDKKAEQSEKSREQRSQSFQDQASASKAAYVMVEYLENKQNPYYIMMERSNVYLEKITNLLAEQHKAFKESLKLQKEDRERQISQSDLSRVGREPNILSQVRTSTTMPPAITEGLGTDTPEQGEGGGLLSGLTGFLGKWWKELGIGAALVKFRGSLMRGLSTALSSIGNLGRSLLGRGARPGGSPSAPRPPTPRVNAPLPQGPAAIPRGAPLPQGPAAPPGGAPSLPGAGGAVPTGAPPVGPAGAPLAAPAAAATTGLGTATLGATAATIGLGVLAGTPLTVGAIAGYEGVTRSEELRDQYPELRGLALGYTQERYLVDNPEMLRQAIDEAKRDGSYDRNMRAWEISQRVVGGADALTPSISSPLQYSGPNISLTAPGTMTPDVQGASDIQRYLDSIQSPVVSRAQSALESISRPQVPLSFGTAVSSTPVIVNNQGGPTSINNGGNVTNIVTGGASLALPQLTFNLPSVMN